MSNITQSEKLFELFLRSSHLIGRGHHHRDGGHHGQGRILTILSKMPTISQRELLDILKIRTASLSELLGKLEVSGYITREKDENDKRNVNVSLTAKGKSAVAEFEQRRQEAAAVLFEVLSDEEKETLSDLLQKLNDAWQQERDDQDLKHWRHHEELHGRHCGGPKQERHGLGPHGQDGYGHGPGRHGHHDFDPREHHGFGPHGQHVFDSHGHESDSDQETD